MNIGKAGWIVLLLAVLWGNGWSQEKGNAASRGEKSRERKAISLGEGDVSDLYLEGVRSLLLENDTKKAYGYFRMALELDSLHGPSNYHLSLILDKPLEALTFSRKAVDSDTTNTWYRYQYAQLLGQTDRYEEAIEVCRSLLRKKNNNPEVYQYLAALYETDKQPYAALATLDSALVLFGDDQSLLEARQEVLLNTGILDRAVENARLLMSLDPFNSHYPLYMAYAYIRQKDTTALHYLRQAETLDSTNVNIKLAYCDFYQSQGRIPEYLGTLARIFSADQIPLRAKISYFNDVLKSPRFYTDYFLYIDNLARIIAAKYPGDTEASKLYAQHLINIGDTDGALKIYKSHLNDSVPDREIYERIVGIEAYLKNADSVLYYARLTMQVFPDNYDVPLMYAHTLTVAERYDEALQTLSKTMKGLSADSLKSVYTCSMGDVYNAMGKPKEAFKQYERSLKYDSDNVMARNNYSYALSEAETELEKALSMAYAVLEKEPSNPTYIDTYAWVLFKMGRYKEAKSSMQKAIALDMNTSPELLLHYGDILFALSEKYNAAIYWRKALDKGADKNKVEERLKQVE